MNLLAYIRDNQVKTMRVWFGPAWPTVLITHCSIISKVSKLPKNKQVYSYLVPWLGYGLVTAETGKQWHRHRRLLTPAFHYSVLKGYVSGGKNCLETFIEKWTASATKGAPVFAFHDVAQLSLDVLMKCVFSSETNCQQLATQHPYVKAVDDLVSLSFTRAKNPLYMIEFVYFLSAEGKHFKRACDIAHGYADDLIRKRRQVLGLDSGRQNEDSRDRVLEETKSQKYLDFLNILLTAEDEDGNGLTDKEIRDEVDTFMFGGYHTITSGMSWALYCLGQHPEHQEKIREEVRSILMGREWLEYDDLKDLKYTTWCIKEALRLYPPLSYFARTSIEDTELDGHVIPKGVTVLADLIQIQRNSDTWENPNEYNPLRFHPSNAEGRHPYAFMPFSIGSRNCIGQHFALDEERVVIASVINRFEISLDETHEVELEPRSILHAKNDIKLKLKLLPLE